MNVNDMQNKLLKMLVWNDWNWNWNWKDTS